jgi:CelD/BcsL family acetyltransferase involved in cellulose biosynthesis
VSLRIVLHREIPEDPELHRQWNSIALKTEQPEVFYTCEWALAMQSSYRASLKPLLFLGYEGDNLAAVASLATDMAGRNVSFLAGTTADYCDVLLTHPQQRAEFIGALFQAIVKMRADKLTLANLPSDSETSSALQNAGDKHGFHVFVRPAYACARVELGSCAQRKMLKDAITHKQMLRRKLRGLERAGAVGFAHLRSWSAIQPALRGFADAHAARFLATGRRSSLATSERRHFLEELARRFSDSGVVTLSILTVNDQTVAWNYGFQFCGSWFWYQPTFDTAWDEHSPGYCLLARIVTEACDLDGINVVDLGLGAEGYKERFGNSTRQTLHVTGTRSLRRHLQEIVRYRAAAVVKRSPKIESAVRRMLAKGSRGRDCPQL